MIVIYRNSSCHRTKGQGCRCKL